METHDTKRQMMQWYTRRVTQLLTQSCFVSWINSLWPGDTIWRQWSWSTLAQVMACCLTAPGHYLNQCWLPNSEVLWHSAESNFTVIAQQLYHMTLKIVLLKLLPHLPINSMAHGKKFSDPTQLHCSSDWTPDSHWQPSLLVSSPWKQVPQHFPP